MPSVLYRVQIGHQSPTSNSLYLGPGNVRLYLHLSRMPSLTKDQDLASYQGLGRLAEVAPCLGCCRSIDRCHSSPLIRYDQPEDADPRMVGSGVAGVWGSEDTFDRPVELVAPDTILTAKCRIGPVRWAIEDTIQEGLQSKPPRLKHQKEGCLFPHPFDPSFWNGATPL
ncbi:hypothetical protein DPEC_G00342110 [Dallia pectoralis]|uniref:Uncharacterized protein n=1 Tax=Dallia pectoralis TaxID=75939 RepID=A0ACC2F5L0_DALPE|nr:hypothetical protein DPEC_G00342110 [Dallia pectoralis]